MLPYILLITIPALWLFVEKYRSTGSLRGALSVDTPSSNNSLVVFFTLFLALLCLRDIYVGCDLVTYRRTFYESGGWSYEAYQELVLQELSQIPEQSTEIRALLEYDYANGLYISVTDYEPLFKLLNGLVANTIFSFRFFIIVCAVLSVVPVAIFCIKESKLPFLTVALFVATAPFSFYFSGLRQIIAMGMMVPMYYCVRDKKFLRFLVFFAIAMGFHYSAVVALGLIPALHLKITRKWMLFLGPLLVAVFIWKEPLLEFVLSLAGSYGQKYANMTTNGAYGMLALFVIFVIYSFVIPDEKEMNSKDFGFRNILLISLAIQLFVPLHNNFMRVGYYYHIFIPVIIPQMARLAHPKLKWLANLSVYVMVVFFFFEFIYNGYTSYDVLQVYPYIPFWK